MTERLFVYGTLAPGRSNEHHLADLEGEWIPGTVRGRLHELGWGAEEGYPGIVLDELGEVVEGFVFASAQLGGAWSRLDAFEGDEYDRVLTTVNLGDGSSLAAFIYVLSSVDAS